MPILALSLGSNIDAASNIRAAVAALRDEFGEILVSSVFESEAVGFDGDNFLNLAVSANTDKPLRQISEWIKTLEDNLGRDRSQQKFSGRTIDIDILTYGEETGSDCNMVLPRPEIIRNAFVLQPLAELLPNQMHVGTGKSFASLWQDYDKSSQRLWSVEFDWQG